MIQDKNNYSLRIHEAGHAVVAYVLKYRFDVVGLGLHHGYLGLKKASVLYSGRPTAGDDLIKIYQAGFIAEEVCTGVKAPEWRSYSDDKVIRGQILASGMSDERLQAITEETKQILKYHKREVRTIAQALEYSNTVTYDQVKSIFNF